MHSDKYEDHIENLVSSLPTLTSDVTIISGDNEEIKTNKFLLSLFNPTLHSVLSTLCCSTSSTILLPDCSTNPIKYLLNIITKGFVVEGTSLEHRRDIKKAAKILSFNLSSLTVENVSESAERKVNDKANGNQTMDVKRKFKTKEVKSKLKTKDVGTDSGYLSERLRQLRRS